MKTVRQSWSSRRWTSAFAPARAEACTYSNPPKNAIYSGRHDYTALAVANKKADAGAMAEWMFQQMMREGAITEQQVRVFWSPPPFVDSVWAARPDLDPKLAESFVNAFLKLDAKNSEQKVILDFFKATKYARANDSDYNLLRRAAKAAGMLK